MIYDNICKATFICRPNRFIAHVLADGKEQICHVKNTGRCKELLVPGAVVYIQKCSSPARKTAYDLIAVEKNGRIINMDAAAPNKAFGEWAANGGLGYIPSAIKPECVFGKSRLDFYLEAADRKIFAEVKGVTLEDKGIVRFPDAPTERGVKHLHELMTCIDAGFEAYAVFVIQMEGVRYFEPNRATHELFADTLALAADKGVHILALDCKVTPDSMVINQTVEVRL